MIVVMHTYLLMLVKWTIAVPKTIASGAAVNNANKKVIFKNCAPFTDWIIETNNTQVDYAQKIHIAIPIYNLIECSEALAKISRGL